MGGSSSIPKALAAGGLLAASLIGAPFAAAQEGPPAPVNFTDPAHALSQGAAINLNVDHSPEQRFAPAPRSGDTSERPRRLELEVAAGGGDSPLDVSVAQRASLGADANGDINRRGRGSEVRIGRGLVEEREDNPSGSSMYAFVASDDEALTWQPGARTEFGGRGPALALDDHVNIGDLSAGVTYERNGIQASLAYVERKESTRVGRQSFSQEEAFTGVTVTMRH